MKKISLQFVFILLMSNALFAQTKCFEIFLNQGYSEFLNGNYEAAVKNYIYANNKCEDKPQHIDIKDSIDVAYECKIYKAAADKEFKNKNYDVAIGFYKIIYTYNPKDSIAFNQNLECSKRLNCFTDSRTAGINKFAVSDYEKAKQNFVNAANCDFLPFFSDINPLIAKTDSCIKYKNLADTHFLEQHYAKAKKYYNQVLTFNPNDDYCKSQINTTELNYFPQTLLIGYSFQSLCPYGISIGYVKNSGIILHNRFDFSEYDIFYSILLGYMHSIYKVKSKIFYFAACTGYGKYADFWYEMGEQAHHATYPHGVQFEGDLFFKTNSFNMGIGCIVPTFDLKYTSVTLNAGININFKDH